MTSVFYSFIVMDKDKNKNRYETAKKNTRTYHPGG